MRGVHEKFEKLIVPALFYPPKKKRPRAERFSKLESKKIPVDTDYYAITGIRAETKQNLSQLRPESIGQASRISGVSPADIQVLMLYFGIN